MSSKRKSSRRRDRLTVLSESVASLRIENEAMKQRERSLEEAKEQLRHLNNELIQRLKRETAEHASFHEAYQVEVSYRCLIPIESFKSIITSKQCNWMHELAVCFMIVHNNIFLHFFV